MGLLPRAVACGRWPPTGGGSARGRLGGTCTWRLYRLSIPVTGPVAEGVAAWPSPGAGGRWHVGTGSRRSGLRVLRRPQTGLSLVTELAPQGPRATGPSASRVALAGSPVPSVW